MKEITFRLIDNTTGLPITGKTDTNIKVRRAPYNVGDIITGLTVTEHGAQGNYQIYGFADWESDVRVFIDTVQQDALGTMEAGDTDDEFVNDNAAETIAGAKTFSSVIICSTAASAATHLIRFGEAVQLANTQTITGQKLFSVHPSATPGSSVFPPTASGHYTPKWYVDDLFGGAIGVVQSTYLNKCIPGRAIDDAYSTRTMEKCNSYLSGLDNIATFRGTILVEPLGQATNTINVDDGTSAWVSAGVDIVGLNKPILNRRGYNSSLTVDSKIQGVKIVDDTVVAARTYVNFTFTDCIFFVDSTEMQFTTCNFYNCLFKFLGGETVTFSACKGNGLTYNDDASVTFDGATTPANIVSTTVTNLGF